jgi:hypothetical protein
MFAYEKHSYQHNGSQIIIVPRIEYWNKNSVIRKEVLRYICICFYGHQWSRFYKILQEFNNKNNDSMPKILFDFSLKLVIKDIY